MATFSNVLTGALQSKLKPSVLQSPVNTPNQTTTPAASKMVPNSNVNIAYGGPKLVPGGGYTSNPSGLISLPSSINTPNSQTKTSPTVTPNSNSQSSNTGTYMNGTAMTSEPPKYDKNGNLTDYGMSVLHANSSSNSQQNNNSQNNNSSNTNQSTTQPSLYGGLIGRATGFQDQAKDLQDKEIALMNNVNQTKTNIMHDPNYSLDTAIGRAGQVDQTFGNQLLGLAQGANYANTNASTAANIANLASPVTQFGQLTNPVTGKVIGAGTSGNNPMLDNAVNSALTLIKNGASQSDAITTSGLSNFGAAGTTALSSALLGGNSGYNPTAQNTQATTNASIGSKYQQQATDLDTSLKQLDTISSLADNFLNNEKLLNPTSNPNYNKAIKTYIANFSNPSDAATYNAILGDIKKFTSQILASDNGTIPTDVAHTLQTFDPSNLSAPQLKTYLENLKQLGQNQLSVLQNQSNSSYGANSGYSGTPTQSSSNTTLAPDANLNITPGQAGQGIVGGALNIGGGIENFFSKAAGVAANIFEL